LMQAIDQREARVQRGCAAAAEDAKLICGLCFASGMNSIDGLAETAC